MSEEQPSPNPPMPPPQAEWQPPAPNTITPGFPPGGTAPVTVRVEQEGLGRSTLRTGLKALVVVAVLALIPMTMMIFFSIMMAALLGSAVSGETDAAFDDQITTFVAGDREGSTHLAAVGVIGPIFGEDRGGAEGFFGSSAGTYGYSVKDELLALAKDDEIDGVLLEMSTPGGTIYGAKAIADGVAEYQRITGKPVVAYVSDISASGGMYAMAGADEIIADHGTFTGSIGVIFGPFAYYDGVTAIDGGLLGGGVTTDGGITFEYLTAGRSKDVGSPYRKMTPEERKVLQEGLDDAYDEFVDHVAESRDLTSSTIKNDLGAMIFGEQQALNNGLIDSIGNRDQAYARLAELAGAEGDDWRLDRVEEPVPSLLSLLAGTSGPDQSPSATATASVCTSGPTVLAIHGDPAQMCATAAKLD